MTDFAAVKDFVAGAFSGAMGCLVGQPMDTVKVRMQTLTGLSSSRATASVVAMETLRHEGIRGFFRGLTPPMCVSLHALPPLYAQRL